MLERLRQHVGSLLPPLGRTGGIFLCVALALTVFGTLMIYSASSVSAMFSADSNYSSTFYLTRQLLYACAGLVAASFLMRWDYHTLCDRWMWVISAGAIFLLALVFTKLAGSDANGATRWIKLGPVRLQPSEFAKVAIILSAAGIIQRFVDGQPIDADLVLRTVVAIVVPIAFIVYQPDKGTTAIIGATVVFMLVAAGMPLRIPVGLAVAGAVGIAALAFHDDYSLERILMRSDPWADEFNAGYQLVQGYYALCSGGLFGVGFGMSRQKYAYLPMAHNDFIFAVIGEELGLLGTTAVLAAFFYLVWQGFRIAREAPDLEGRLVATGGSSMLAIQLLVNVCGVVGIIPLSGKPIPFLSYGGSSIISTLLIVGVVLSVAHASQVVEPVRRSEARGYERASARGLRVIPGGALPSPEAERLSRRRGSEGRSVRRSSRSAGASRGSRVDLGPSARDRLRRY